MTESLPIFPTGPTPRKEAADDLERDGWVRRHLVEPGRAQESIELYRDMGFEVMTREPTPGDFGSECQDCAITACKSWVVVYTRKK